MKITLYELLGMFKDGKAPKIFKFDSYVWTFNYESFAYRNGKGIEFEDYMDDGLMKYLNDEVEILEEEKKIPEKEKIYKIEDDLPYESLIVWQRANNKIFEKQINEIIDYLKSKGE